MLLYVGWAISDYCDIAVECNTSDNPPAGSKSANPRNPTPHLYYIYSNIMYIRISLLFKRWHDP